MSKGCRFGIDTHAGISSTSNHVRIVEYIDGTEYKIYPFHPDYLPVEKVGLINGTVAIHGENG